MTGNTDRFEAFMIGLAGLDKEARKGLPMAPVLATTRAVWPFLVGAPLVAGGLAGALASRVSSPNADVRAAQKELVLAEIEEAVLEMERKRDLAKLGISSKPATRHERPLHI